MNLWQISTKPQDFIICKGCRAINRYENERCHDCGDILDAIKQYSVEEWCEDEYEYWTDDGWKTEDADEVRYRVG